MNKDGRKGQNRTFRNTIEQAKQLYDQGNVTIIETVNTDKYGKVHLQRKEAIRINPTEIADGHSQA